MTNQLETLDQIRRTAIDLSIQFGPKVLVATAILVAGFFTGRWVAGILDRTLSRFELEPPVRLLLMRITRILILALFAIMALQNLGVELLPLIAGLGVAGAGIALAMQGVLGNIVAGLTIIFTRPFRVGDYVSMVGVEGRVAVIDIFTTTLAHFDLSRVVVPNRKIIGEILHNYGQIRQLDVQVGVAYETDLNRALAIVHRTLAANSMVLQDPAPLFGVQLVGDSAIRLAVRPWVNVPDFVVAGAQVNKAIIEAFRAEGITMPLPQREIRILSGG